MLRLRKRSLLVASLFLALAALPAHARDWFVRAGSSGGDGSMQKPFADPWEALEKCEAGDAVHVTEGKYYGRLGLGTWKLPFDGVQLIGGYDKGFKERNPWVHLTELLWDKTSKNWPKEERLGSQGKGVVVDGIVIDMQDQNEYVDPARSGRRDKASEAAMRFTEPATVRNSVIVNPGEAAIQCVGGSLIENNLIVNAVGWGVEVKSGRAEPATIRRNTIVFTWTFKEPGQGAYQGSAVSLQGPAVVTGNVLAHNDNNGIYQTASPEKISITGNVFFMNLYSNLKFGVNGKLTGIDDKSMDLLEEVGLKAHEGNVVQNPGLALDKAWLGKYGTRTAGKPGKLDMNDWNQLRQSLGMTLVGGAYTQASGVAPPWELAKALALMQPKSAPKAGAHAQPLEVKLSAAPVAAAASAASYRKAELTSWNGQPASVAEQALEMTVAIGSVANIGGIPAKYPQDQHAAVTLYDRNGKGERVTGFYRKGSSVQRAVDEATGFYQGSGVPDRLYVVRGVAHPVNNLPKAGFFIESIEPFSGGSGGAAGSSAAAEAPRPKGRDWFVRAGSSGGDGSREKPFKDPWQALEKATPGDSIHVSEGEYNGKLRAGNWKIPTTSIALLGGYDKDFRTRNPWTHPTFLKTGADYKGHRSGYTVEGGAEDHSGAILDGFVFDKRGDNTYTAKGDLDYSNSDKEQHVWLSRPGSVIRNNVFLNGAEGALRTANGVTVENNIFVNHHIKTVDVQRGFGNAPFVFRGNTVAFAWDIRFGTGKTSGGSLLILGTGIRAIVDNNIFEFADNDAIRLIADAKDVELTRNVFSHNLWSDVMRPGDWVSVDDRTFGKLGDFGWKKLEGNVVMSSGLPLDTKWFDVYLNRTAFTPGKVTMDDWNELRQLLGQPVIARGGKAGEGFMPALDWRQAATLFPKNPKVKAGARASDLTRR